MSVIALKIILITIATPFIIVALLSHILVFGDLYEIFYSERWLYLNRWKRVDTWVYIILSAYFLIILGLSFFYSFWFLLGLIPSGMIYYFILVISFM